jgi:hypothetical protein
MWRGTGRLLRACREQSPVGRYQVWARTRLPGRHALPQGTGAGFPRDAR